MVKGWNVRQAVLLIMKMKRRHGAVNCTRKLDKVEWVWKLWDLMLKDGRCFPSLVRPLSAGHSTPWRES